MNDTLPAQPSPIGGDRIVLLVISGGLISILLSVIAGLFISPRALPNWAENVLVSVGTASTLRLGDCLATLIQLSTSKSVERMVAPTMTPAVAPPVDPLAPATKVEVVNPPEKPVNVTDPGAQP